MSEFLGLAYLAEVPVVLFNVQRGGPSTGMPTRTQQSDILACAWASHGDTRHVLLFPSTPTECFTMGAEAFDLADRLQTPVIVMSDLDIGMNEWVTDELSWDDAREPDRGKVLTAEGLEQFKARTGIEWGRYQDVDGDAIPYRTLPGTHPTRGAYFTRGTSHDENARYTEDGTVHARVLDRIRRKFVTAATMVPGPELTTGDAAAATGIIHFGSSVHAVREAVALLADDGVAVDALRIRAFPFTDAISRFCEAHDRVLVVEQNRDGQMRMLLMAELGVPAAKLVPALSYDGRPMTADFVRQAVLAALRPAGAVAAG
jgi:2-oxoglutarate ferredoxin oxidoreductase subunit alpha